jgi:Coenzyme PQQ synthesis protein D (PqqD)
MLSMKSILRPREHVAYHPTAEGGILVNLRSGAYFELNRIGAKIWTGLQAGHSVGETVETIRSSYNVVVEVAASDVERICEEMLKADLVVAPNEG